MVPSLAAGFWGVTNLSGCRCLVYQIGVVLCGSHTPLEDLIIRIESWKGRLTPGWATVPVDAVVLGDRLPLTSVVPSQPALKALLTSSPAGPEAPQASASRKPSRLPAPARPSAVGSLASRLCSRPTRASLVSGEPGRQSSSASSPGRDPHGCRSGREAPQASGRGGSPGTTAAPGQKHTHAQAPRLVPAALTVSRCRPAPRSSSSWPPPARSQRSPLLRASQADRRPRGPQRPATVRSTRRKACARASAGSTRQAGPAPSRSGDVGFVWFSAPPVSRSGEHPVKLRSPTPASRVT